MVLQHAGGTVTARERVAGARRMEITIDLPRASG